MYTLENIHSFAKRFYLFAFNFHKEILSYRFFLYSLHSHLHIHYALKFITIYYNSILFLFKKLPFFFQKERGEERGEESLSFHLPICTSRNQLNLTKISHWNIDFLKYGFFSWKSRAAARTSGSGRISHSSSIGLALIANICIFSA